MKNRPSQENLARPASVTTTWINLAGLLGLFAALYFLGGSRLRGFELGLWVILAIAVPILFLECLVLKVHRRASTGLRWDAGTALAPARVATKLLGLALTLAAVAFGYWLFPEYHSQIYRPYWDFLQAYGPWLLCLAVPYFFFVDARMANPYDAYWQMGRLALARKGLDWRLLGDHARGWLIKAFFLPLMFVYLCQHLEKLERWTGISSKAHFLVWYDFSYQLLFTVDLAFACVGYILSMRLFDTHLRSAEPTLLGWAVALMCYQPFSNVVNSAYLGYEDTLTWERWLLSNPDLQMVWGGMILVLLGVYAYSTVAFGCRFSNLTHRGILTHGPYRYSKHPAYLSKNLSWWLISVPFISSRGWDVAMQHCLLLLAMNYVYFLRARTEERHLSADPDYVTYALWMNEHALLRGLGKWLPCLRYRAPASGRIEKA